MKRLQSWSLWWVIAIGSIAAILGACDSGPVQCPTLRDSAVTTLQLDFDLKWPIQLAIEDQLRDPGSYDYEKATANRRNAATRADGSSYYSSIVVGFSAKNALGVKIPGAAEVRLSEDAEGECAVRDVELF